MSGRIHKIFTLFSFFYASYLLHIKIKCYYMITNAKILAVHLNTATLVTAITTHNNRT